MKRKKKEKKQALILRLVRRFGYNPGRVSSEILEWVEILIVALALALLVISFVTVRMHVPTDSMYPTINGDRSIFKADSFFVDKISYHFRVPKPGDIVVFWHTETVLVKEVKDGSRAARAGLNVKDRIIYINQQAVAAGADESIASLPEGTHIYLTLYEGRQLELGLREAGIDSLADLGILGREKRVRYVKRLIAVGGQTVYIKGGDIYLNEEKLEGERFDRHYTSSDPRMHYGVTPTLVPEGKWLVLGDNSDDSWDSRFWGFVDEDDFIGEPYLRVWPLPRFGPMNGYFSLHGKN